MAGIVLVTKPSFLFADNDHLVLNGSWVGNNISNNWRKQYEEGTYFFFDLRSKFHGFVMKSTISYQKTSSL